MEEVSRVKNSTVQRGAFAAMLLAIHRVPCFDKRRVRKALTGAQS